MVRLFRSRQKGKVVRRLLTFFCLTAASALCLISCSCMFIMAEARAFDKTAKRIVTVSPVKAHLYDGSVVVFPEGVRTKGNVLKGDGIRYDLTRQSSLRVRSVERDSVAFMESYEGKILPGPTFVSIAGIGVSTIFLLVVTLATVTTIRGAME